MFVIETIIICAATDGPRCSVSRGFEPVFDDRPGSRQDEAAPQFTNAMTRPRPANWPALNIILRFRETRSELGNWAAVQRHGSRTRTDNWNLKTCSELNFLLHVTQKYKVPIYPKRGEGQVQSLLRVWIQHSHSSHLTCSIKHWNLV